MAQTCMASQGMLSGCWSILAKGCEHRGASVLGAALTPALRWHNSEAQGPHSTQSSLGEN